MSTIVLTRPKILVCFGSDQNVDLTPDQKIIKDLEEKGARITYLGLDKIPTTRNSLRNYLSNQSWDIFFFAGHSYSYFDEDNIEDGRLFLSHNEEISIKELRTSLQEAAHRGLKLTIFNSCDGLHLASNCANYGISNTIFMKEPIPDKVAHDFLEIFLKEFSQEKTLDLSLRKTKQHLEDKYEQNPDATDYIPGVSWLPTLFKIPAQPDIIWQPPRINWLAIVLGLLSLSLITVFGPKMIRIINNMFNPPDLRFSSCEQILINDDSQNPNLIKQGASACQDQNFTLANSKFKEYLALNKNNPEVVIYKNNAEAIKHNPLKLAVVVPIGSNPDIAKEILRGVAQGQQEINQNGGINGRYLHFTIVNDSNDPFQAREVADKLVKNNNIIAVIGHNASNASLAAAPVYQQGGLVMINPTSSANGIPNVGNYIFRTATKVNIMAKLLVDSAKKSSKKIAICSDSQAYDGISFVQEFIAAWLAEGGQLAATVCDLNDPDFFAAQEINEAVEKGADTLLIIPHINKPDNAYQLAKANGGKLKLLGNNTLGTYTTLANGSAVVGMTIVVPWSAKSPANAPFGKEALAFWGGNVTWRTATAYDAIHAIAEGLKKDKTNTRNQLQQALANNTFVAKSINGEVRFLPNGDRVLNPVIIQVVPSKTAQTGYDFQLSK